VPWRWENSPLAHEARDPAMDAYPCSQTLFAVRACESSQPIWHTWADTRSVRPRPCRTVMSIKHFAVVLPPRASRFKQAKQTTEDQAFRCAKSWQHFWRLRNFRNSVSGMRPEGVPKLSSGETLLEAAKGAATRGLRRAIREPSLDAQTAMQAARRRGSRARSKCAFPFDEMLARISSRARRPSGELAGRMWRPAPAEMPQHGRVAAGTLANPARRIVVSTLRASVTYDWWSQTFGNRGNRQTWGSRSPESEN